MPLLMSDLLTVKEAAEYIGVTNKAIYLAIEMERIHPVRLLGKLGISLDEAKKYKKARKLPTNGNGKKKAA
jgi:excisionase family DNA binding protein